MSQLEEYLFKADDASLFNVEEPIFKIDETSAYLQNNNNNMSNEPFNWQKIRCRRHPHFHITTLSIDESGYDEPQLICMKCLTEEDNFRETKRFVAVKDLMQNYFDNLSKNCSGDEDDPNKVLEGKFIEFCTQNYGVVYEKHLETQYKKIDQEIASVIEDLTKLREKYLNFYSNELLEVQKKTGEIKRSFNKYLEEKSSDDTNHLVSQFNTVKSYDDFCRFLRRIHHLSKGVKPTAGPICYDPSLLRTIEEFKEKALSLEERTANIEYLHDIKQTIQPYLRLGAIFFKSQHNNNNKERKVLTENTKIVNTQPMKIKEENEDEANRFWGKPSLYKYSADEKIFFDDADRKPVNNFKPSQIHEPMSEFRRMSMLNAIGSQALKTLMKEVTENENGTPIESVEGKKKFMKSLHDWSRRRITGYLIFRNTVAAEAANNENKEGKEDRLGVHLNSLVGHRWKSLTKQEKEEYQKLAEYHRDTFINEVEQEANEGDFSNLLKTLDTKIKKIKKE